MARIPANRAAELFEEIVGWPYKLGGSGTGANREIDCSGAWVRVYRAYGLRIDHGSNSQYRRFCAPKGPIAKQDDLHAGIAVFKRRALAA